MNIYIYIYLFIYFFNEKGRKVQNTHRNNRLPFLPTLSDQSLRSLRLHIYYPLRTPLTQVQQLSFPYLVSAAGPPEHSAELSTLVPTSVTLKQIRRFGSGEGKLEELCPRQGAHL